MVEGGCRCGAVRYTLALDRLPVVYACHCHTCQRASGSAFSLQALVPESDLHATGELIVREITTEDRTSIQRFCAACLARVYNTNSGRPGIAVVRAGTLDTSENLVCVAHIFTDFRQRWVDIPHGVQSWPDMPPSAEFMRALTSAQ